MAENRSYAVVILAACLLLCLPAQAAKPRVIVHLVVATEADGVLIRDKVAEFLQGKGLVRCSSTETNRLPSVVQQLDGTWAVDASLCFSQRIDAQDWKEDIRQKWASAPPAVRKKILPGSRVSFHVCANEESEKNRYNCRTHVLAEFSEVSK